jgi:TolA-binding protein
MRQFSILVIFALAFGGAAVLYEQEARKVKGVLSQITELQAQVGDMQVEIKRLNGELETVKLSERRRPNLQTIASRVLREDKPTQTRSAAKPQTDAAGQPRQLIASDVTSAPPAIRSRGENAEDDEWSRPTVDAEYYEAEAAVEPAEGEPSADPYE